MRRTGLKRDKPLERGTSQLKRTRLQPVSKRRVAERPERAEMRERVFTRDLNVCRLAHVLPASCMGRLTAHHLMKEGQGGPYTLCNLLTLCVGHNEWVEDNPDAAYALGLVIRRGETFDDAWARLAAAGLVDWRWSGGPAL